MGRHSVALIVAVVLIGLAGCTATPWGVGDRAELDTDLGQASAGETAAPDPGTDGVVESSGVDSADGVDLRQATASTFRVMATTDDDLFYRFTVDGDVSRTVADDGTAAEDDDTVENADGTTTVVGSTGDMAGDAYLVDGEVTSFERTGGESLYRLFLDGEEVTEELTPGSTFEIVSTDDDAEFSFEFTMGGEVQRVVSENGHAGDASDDIVENDDGTVTVQGSTGFGSGDAFAVVGEVASFERTEGESDFELYLDGEEVTDELGPPDGGDDGDDGDDADGADEYRDSTFDVSHTRSIESNDDGTTTISGEVWSHAGVTVEDLVIVVEVYDDVGEWLDSEWVEVDAVTPERQAYSVTVDVPRGEIADFEVDVNQNTQAGSGTHPGRCHEIDGDGPDDQKPEAGSTEVIHVEDHTIVVADVYNGKGRTIGMAHATVAVYDEGGDRIGTATLILEDLADGEQREFAVRFDRDERIDRTVVDVDEVAINYHGELVCRPPL